MPRFLAARLVYKKPATDPRLAPSVQVSPHGLSDNSMTGFSCLTGHLHDHTVKANGLGRRSCELNIGGVFPIYTKNGRSEQDLPFGVVSPLMHRLYRSNLETALGELKFLAIPERSIVDHLFRSPPSVYGVLCLYPH